MIEMLKKLLYVVLSAALLASCGGGSGDSVYQRSTLSFITPSAAFTDDEALRYIASHGDLIAALGPDPEAGRRHYYAFGQAEGRGISFKPLEYVASYPDLIAAIGTDTKAASLHFITTGFKQGRTVQFEPYRYLASYPELLVKFKSDLDGATAQYITVGYGQGRRSTFDALSYIASHGDLIQAFGSDVLAGARHFVEFGFSENRNVSFNADNYLANYRDLFAAFGTDAIAATLHFINHGFTEGRSAPLTGGSPVLNPLNCNGSPIITGFIADTFYQPASKVLSGFQGTSFNTVSTIVAWSVAEKDPDQVDITPYLTQLDALANNGFCLILLLDTAGRPLRTSVAARSVDVSTIPETSQPTWIGKYSVQPKSVDFGGVIAGPLDFSDADSLPRVKKFYESVITQLQARYGKKIIAIAPCITGECEIKYAQNGFRWQSYSDNAKRAFSTWLIDHGIPTGELPIMNYPNMLGWGIPNPERLYPYMQSFREDVLAQYACSLTSIIRNHSFPALGYFAQVFSFTDGIYATGAIEKLSSCFDAAAIDYNFYNGYDVELKPQIPRFLASYALRLGYKSVIVGLYAERFKNEATGVVDPAVYTLIKQSLAGIEPNAGIAGAEIGNLESAEFANVTGITSLVQAMNYIRAKPAPTKKIAIYASVVNSYLWEGDWSNNRQIIQDNLIATYLRLKTTGAYQVDIVGDAELSKPTALSKYDLIVLPHVSTMPPIVRANLMTYYSNGGKLLADMSFDAYNPDATVQRDQSFYHALGIGASQGYMDDRVFLGASGSRVVLAKTQYYANGFLMAPMPGFNVSYALENAGGEGIVLEGSKSTVFGFLPLFVGGQNATWGEKLFDAQVTRLLQ